MSPANEGRIEASNEKEFSKHVDNSHFPEPSSAKEEISHDNNTSKNPNSWRSSVGLYMESISDTANQHKATARYGTIATILLLSAYGLSQTPLFARFKTVADIPTSYFVNRRTIHGRLIRVVDFDRNNNKTIQCYVFHLSPFGRLLSRWAFDFVIRTSPSAGIGRRLEENTDELLKVEIGGVKIPSDYGPQHVERIRQWLDQLVEQKTVVSCQMLARRIVNERDVASNHNPIRASVVDLTTLRPEIAKNMVSQSFEQSAVCKISFRTTALQVFPTDMATTLVRSGYVIPTETLYSSTDINNSQIVDASTALDLIKGDNRYIKRLERAEFDAAKEYQGMWADPTVREKRGDIVDEVEFQTNASILKKLWRWLRG